MKRGKLQWKIIGFAVLSGIATVTAVGALISPSWTHESIPTWAFAGLCALGILGGTVTLALVEAYDHLSE